MISYSADTGNPVNFRNKVVITLKTDVVKVLQTIEVNNVSYGSNPISGVNNGYTLQNSNGDDIPGDLFTDNEDIIVELTYTDSSKGRAVSTLQRGLMVFNGYAWVNEPIPETWAREGNSDKFPDAKQNTDTWAREGNTDPAPVIKLRTARLTQAAYNALADKSGVYFIVG